MGVGRHQIETTYSISSQDFKYFILNKDDSLSRFLFNTYLALCIDGLPGIEPGDFVCYVTPYMTCCRLF